jgi:outer membrane protein
MKKYTLLYNAAILSLVVIVTSAYVAKEAAPSKVGYLSINQLVYQIPEYRQNRLKLDTAIYEFDTVLKGKVTEFQQKQQAFVKDSATMKAIIKKDKYNELQSMSQSIQAFKQLSDREVAKQDSAFVQPVLNSVQNAIKLVAKEYGLTHVLNTDVRAENGSPMVLYAGEENDITKLVLAAYKKKK